MDKHPSSGRIFTAAACTVLLLSSGCTAMSRMASYGNRAADVDVTVDGAKFAIWIHPKEETMAIQRRGFGVVGQAIAEGLTLGVHDGTLPFPYYRKAARSVTEPAGCEITDLYELDHDITFEAAFACPAGVDLRADVLAAKERRRRR